MNAIADGTWRKKSNKAEKENQARGETSTKHRLVRGTPFPFHKRGAARRVVLAAKGGLSCKKEAPLLTNQPGCPDQPTVRGGWWCNADVGAGSGGAGAGGTAGGGGGVSAGAGSD